MLSTMCPICRERYQLHEMIAKSQGIVECESCETVFDGLASLTKTRAKKNTAVSAETIQVGDREILKRTTLPRAKPWFPTQEIATAGENRSVANDRDGGFDFALPRSGEGIGFFGLSLRNLIRYRRRSIVAMSAIVFGVIAILLAGGFIEWILEAMRESAIRSQYGHVQIVRSGYIEQGAAEPLAYLLPSENSIIERIENESEVDTVAPRLNFSGLASRDETTISFVGEGVDPAKEERLSEGVTIRAGEDLSAEAPDKIIVGAGLAEIMGVAPGDGLVLLATSSSGGISAVEVTVGGIFFTAVKTFDDSALRMHIDTARELLRIEGSHRWLVLLDETNQTDATVRRIRDIMSGHDNEFDVIPWSELADFYTKTEKLFSRQINLVWIVIGLLILLSISNTMMMSVLERTREIGTLMALGLTRKSILRLFLQEGAVLGIVGGAAGVFLGIALALIISKIGIPMPPPPGMDVGFTAEILVTKGLTIAGMLVAVLATTAAAVYPAWKASQLNVVDALRHNQ